MTSFQSSLLASAYSFPIVYSQARKSNRVSGFFPSRTSFQRDRVIEIERRSQSSSIFCYCYHAGIRWTVRTLKFSKQAFFSSSQRNCDGCVIRKSAGRQNFIAENGSSSARACLAFHKHLLIGICKAAGSPDDLAVIAKFAWPAEVHCTFHMHEHMGLHTKLARAKKATFPPASSHPKLAALKKQNSTRVQKG